MSEKPEALRLADELSMSHLSYHINHAAAAELRRLHAENEALRKDAARYRHMRDAVRTNELLVYSKGCDLDAAIDAAIKAVEEGK